MVDELLVGCGETESYHSYLVDVCNQVICQASLQLVGIHLAAQALDLGDKVRTGKGRHS